MVKWSFDQIEDQTLANPVPPSGSIKLERKYLFVLNIR